MTLGLRDRVRDGVVVAVGEPVTVRVIVDVGVLAPLGVDDVLGVPVRLADCEALGVVMPLAVAVVLGLWVSLAVSVAVTLRVADVLGVPDDVGDGDGEHAVFCAKRSIPAKVPSGSKLVPLSKDTTGSRASAKPGTGTSWSVLHHSTGESVLNAMRWKRDTNVSTKKEPGRSTIEVTDGNTPPTEMTSSVDAMSDTGWRVALSAM